jgi:hypothetical protein
MQIDLSTFRSVRVDPAARRVWATGGTLLGQIDKETAPHELVTPLGTVSHTGVGGLTLGGGFGRIARKFGMAVDNLESVDIVTADGKVVHASARENPELYWGARGGSGNFGVVTQFEFKLHPMKREVIAGSVLFPIARMRDVLTLWGEYAPAAPDELYFDPTVMQPPGNAPGMAMLQVCYSGPQADAERALAPIRKLGTPLKDTIKGMEYVQVHRSGDSTDTFPPPSAGPKSRTPWWLSVTIGRPWPIASRTTEPKLSRRLVKRNASASSKSVFIVAHGTRPRNSTGDAAVRPSRTSQRKNCLKLSR